MERENGTNKAPRANPKCFNFTEVAFDEQFVFILPVSLRQFRGLRCVERVSLTNKAPRANPNDFKITKTSQAQLSIL